jgi:hypothetical protein
MILIIKMVKKIAGIVGSAGRRVDITAAESATPVPAPVKASISKPANDVAAQIASIVTQSPEEAAGVLSSMLGEEE